MLKQLFSKRKNKFFQHGFFKRLQLEKRDQLFSADGLVPVLQACVIGLVTGRMSDIKAQLMLNIASVMIFLHMSSLVGK